MYERILVPLDGSERAEAVLERVTPIAGKLGSEVVLLQVVSAFSEILGQTLPRESFPSPTLQDVSVEAARERQESEQAGAEAYLRRIAEDLTAKGLKVGFEVREGPAPAAVILAVALDLGCDLIAMSTHGRSGIGRAVFGSVADDVLRNSPLPLLLIRG
jgi:nucleotide-binding universal stress UspA family protein